MTLLVWRDVGRAWREPSPALLAVLAVHGKGRISIYCDVFGLALRAEEETGMVDLSPGAKEQSWKDCPASDSLEPPEDRAQKRSTRPICSRRVMKKRI